MTGALLLDKPAGPTSHDVVARVRRALGTRAVGHTGTLDPFATGLLVMLVGRATRLARFVEQQAKTYLATAILGVRTSTDDLTGTVIAGGAAVPAGLEEGHVRAALASFLGAQLQRPPAYSAKKVSGERSYVRARRGEAVALADVPVTVHALELLDYLAPTVRFRATVSAGTYLRAVARDLGDRLGVGAHLSALRRERIGPLRVEDAIPLDRLDRDTPLLAPLAVLTHLARSEVTDGEARDLGHGRPVEREAGAGLEGSVVLTRGERVVAVAEVDGRWLRPVVVLETA